MGKLILVAMAIIFFGAAAIARPRPDFESPRGHELRRDIICLNLLNGLYLSVDQMKGFRSILLDLAAEEEALRAEAKSSEAGLLAALEELHSTVSRGEVPGEALRHRVHQWSGPQKEARVDYEERLRDLGGRLQRLLTPAQRSQVARYRPCTVPHKSLTNPTSIGSASVSEGMARHFDRIRSIPPRAFAFHGGRIVERMLGRVRMMSHGRADLDAEQVRIEDFLIKIRSMSDMDWELSKQDEVGAFRKSQEERFGPRHLSGEGALERKLEMCLLNTRLLRVLDTRMGGQKAD